MNRFGIRADPDSFCIDDILDVVERKYHSSKLSKKQTAIAKKEQKARKKKTVNSSIFS